MLDRDFMVSRTPEEVLGRARVIFARRLPHPGKVRLFRASVAFEASARLRYGRFFLETIKVALLSALSVGVYLIYWLVFRRGPMLKSTFWAEVFAREEESENGTLVRVSSGREDYQNILEGWVVKELGGQPREHSQ